MGHEYKPEKKKTNLHKKHQTGADQVQNSQAFIMTPEWGKSLRGGRPRGTTKIFVGPPMS